MDMRKDLFGQTNEPSQVQVKVYADEVKPSYKNKFGERWMYIGILAIPENKYRAALDHLVEDRGEARYDGAVHFVELSNHSTARVYNRKTLLAKKWIERILWDSNKIFHFYVLGLNLLNLRHEAFGTGKEQDRNIYNRFFRTALAYALKGYFSNYDQIIVSDIFHHAGHMDTDDLFDWHSIWRLETSEEKLSFDTSRIVFVESDHRKELRYPDASNFIQLTDVILGSVRCCLDATTTRAGCVEIATSMLPLAERLTNEKSRSNPHSRYRYFRRCSVSFFPRKKLSAKQLADPWEVVQSSFYNNRSLLLKEQISGQQSFW